MDKDKLKRLFGHISAGIMAGIGPDAMHPSAKVHYGFSAEELATVKGMTLNDVWNVLKPPPEPKG